MGVLFMSSSLEEVPKKRSKGKSKSRTTTMIVKNVLFETTKKEIRELFGYVFFSYSDVLLPSFMSTPQAQGHLKSIHLPKKIDSCTRGFVFLGFVSHVETRICY